jgi:hypothetical protein
VVVVVQLHQAELLQLQEVQAAVVQLLLKHLAQEHQDKETTEELA